MKTAKKDKDKDKKGRNTWRSADVKLRAIKLSKSGKSRSEIAKEMNISYSPLQLEPTFWGFPYKMPLGARVKTYLKVMINPPILFQLLAVMWKASP